MSGCFTASASSINDLMKPHVLILISAAVRVAITPIARWYWESITRNIPSLPFEFIGEWFEFSLRAAAYFTHCLMSACVVLSVSPNAPNTTGCAPPKRSFNAFANGCVMLSFVHLVSLPVSYNPA